MASIVLGSTPVITESSGTASIADGVNFPTGHIVQVTNKRQVILTSVGNTELKFFENFITLELANSNIYVDFQTTIGTFSTYRDTDIAFAMGWKSTTETTSASDYTRIHGADTTLLARQQVTNLGTFWNTDTSPSGGQGDQYFHYLMSWRGDVDIGNHAAGTKIYVACWINSDGNADNFIIGGPDAGSTTNAATETFLNIWELSA